MVPPIHTPPQIDLQQAWTIKSVTLFAPTLAPNEPPPVVYTSSQYLIVRVGPNFSSQPPTRRW